MSRPTHQSRTAIARAELFLALAEQCDFSTQNEHEAFLEVAMIYGRAELQRLEPRYEDHPEWKAWWKSLLDDPSVQFLRNERNTILHEAPPRIGQVIGGGPTVANLYYYGHDHRVAALETIKRHIARIKELSAEAHQRFGTTPAPSTAAVV